VTKRLRVPWPQEPPINTLYLSLRSMPGKMAAENKRQLEEFSWQALDSPSVFGGSAQPVHLWGFSLPCPAWFLICWGSCWRQHLCVLQRRAQKQNSAPSWFIFQTKPKILRVILLCLGFVISANSLDFPDWEGLGGTLFLHI